MVLKTYRLAVISDVHGNLPALEAALTDIHEQGVDAIAAAGDLTSGVWPEEVVTRMLDLTRWCIAGNHERYYTSLHRRTAAEGWDAGQQWVSLRWCYDRLSKPTLASLDGLPDQLTIAIDGTDPIRLLHGSPAGIADRLYPDRDPVALGHFRRGGLLPSDPPPPLAEAVAEVAEPVVVCGHTHIPWAQDVGHHLVVNAGAMGGALNGDVRAQYMILTWSDGDGGWRAVHYAVPYDLDAVREGFVQSGYLGAGGAFTRAILRNVEAGLNWPGALLRHVYVYARAQGWENVDDLSDDLWDSGAATFDWYVFPESQRRTNLWQ